MDEKEIAVLRKQAGIVLIEQEAMGTTELIVELRHLAHQWDASHPYTKELLDTLEKHRKD